MMAMAKNNLSIDSIDPPILKPEGKMGDPKTRKSIKALEITRAYAEYKTRHAGDLDADLANWVNNIIRFIAIKKSKK